MSTESETQGVTEAPAGSVVSEVSASPVADPPPQTVTVTEAQAAPPVIRLVQRRRPGVAILGFTDHRSQAPFNNPDFEVWGLNELYRYMDPKQFTRWFEIHDRAMFEAPPPKGDPEHLKSLAGITGMPIYMQRQWPDIPCSVPLPKAQIEAACGKYGAYQTSSISWMIGLAILEGFRAIHVYGVDMAQDTEYKEQRPCCEFLLGMAAGRGIDIYVPQTSDLLKAIGQYGFGDGSAFSKKAVERTEWLHRERATMLQRIDALDNEFTIKQQMLQKEYAAKKEGMVANRYQLEGAIDDCVYWKRSWGLAGTDGKVSPDRGEAKLASTG